MQIGAPSLRDVAQYPHIQLTADGLEQSTRRYWKRKRIASDIAFRTSSMEALRALVRTVPAWPYCQTDGSTRVPRLTQFRRWKPAWSGTRKYPCAIRAASLQFLIHACVS